MADSVSSRTRRLLVGTTALSVPLILLGIYTAIGGFGLTCEARWPLCDGAVFGLFPANWGSFVEWFHRFVAMIFGFAIIGTALSLWRGGAPRRSSLAVYAATALTPLQIVFGALTVTSYERLILATHFVTAIVIFLLLVVASIWVFEGDAPLPSVRRTAAIAAGLLVLGLPLVPGSTVAVALGFSQAGIHTSFYLFTLLATGAFVAGAATTDGSVRLLALGGGAAVVTSMVVSRIALFPTTTLAVFLGLIGSIGAAIAVAKLSDGSEQSRPPRAEPERGSA